MTMRTSIKLCFKICETYMKTYKLKLGFDEYNSDTRIVFKIQKWNEFCRRRPFTSKMDGNVIRIGKFVHEDKRLTVRKLAKT